MLQLIRAFIDIAVWRRGPQHLPASVLLFVVTLAVYVAISLGVNNLHEKLARPRQEEDVTSLALFAALVSITVTVVWIGLMLAIVRRSPRFFQTATAVFAARIVIEPVVVLVPALFARVGVAMAGGILFPFLFAWYVVAIAHVVRSALDVKLLAATLLTAAYVVCDILITSQFSSGY